MNKLINLTVIILAIFKSVHAIDCTNNEDCIGIEGAGCMNNICGCSSGKILDMDTFSCLDLAPYVGSACTQNSQCQRLISGFRCDNVTRSCSCNEGFRYIEGRCWPISLMGQSCSVRSQCYDRLMPHGLDCIEGVCDCAAGYYRRERTCRKISSAVNEACILDFDCQIPGVENATCVNMACAISQSYSMNDFYNVISMDQTKSIVPVVEGSECSSDQDCASLASSECSPQKHCVCKRGYYINSQGTICLSDLGQPVVNSNQCVGLMARVANGVCDCPNGFFYDELIRNCIKPTRTFNESCVNNDNCYTFGEASICVNLESSPLRVCDCDASISVKRIDRMICSLVDKEIGETCFEDDICPTGSECSEGTCTCTSGFFPSEDNSFCVEAGLGLGETCLFDLQCGTENAECSDQICTCKENHFEMNNSCFLGIGGRCETQLDCKVSFTTCDNSTCQCLDNFVESGGDRCLRKSNALGGDCEIDKQCWSNFGGEEAVLCNNGECSCRDDYHERVDACWKITNLGDVCTTSSQCHLPGGLSWRTECRNSRCHCKWEYVRLYSPDSCGGGSSLYSFSWTILILLSITIFKFY